MYLPQEGYVKSPSVKADRYGAEQLACQKVINTGHSIYVQREHCRMEPTCTTPHPSIHVRHREKVQRKLYVTSIMVARTISQGAGEHSAGSTLMVVI